VKNINTTGTFDEYMDSVVIEIQRLLSDYYRVVTEATKWLPDQPARIVKIFGDDGWNTSFSIAEFEFDKNEQPTDRVELADVRFNYVMLDLEEAR